MQTIDTIRRTNELSKVLKQHGFAEDSLAAVEKANDLSGAETDALQPDFHSADTSHLLQKMANLERSKHHLSSRLDAAVQAQESMQSQLQQVVARLDAAEAKLRLLRNQPEQTEAPAAEQAAPVKKEQHPRQAEESEAYSIEKVFYCGAK